MEIPPWWIVVSGVFFIFGILLNVALIFAVVKLIQVVSSLQPQVKTLIERVDGITQKVDDMSKTMHATVTNVGTKTQSFVGKFEDIALESTSRLGAISKYLVTGFAILRLYREFQASRPRKAIDTKGSTKS